MPLYPPQSPDWQKLYPSDAIQDATYGLYFGDELVGMAFAIHPRIVISAGHHYSVDDDVGDFSVRSLGGTSAEAIYAQKLPGDLLILWLSKDVKYVSLFGLQPVVGMRVATCWIRKAPHRELLVSPGTITFSTPKLCQVKGSVSCKGASGGPVVDNTGDHVVGLHVGRETTPTVRLTEFVSARHIISLLVEAGVDPTAPWAESDPEEEQPSKPNRRSPTKSSRKRRRH